VAGGSFSDAKDQPFTADDIRFTKNGDDLYMISLDNPVHDLNIKSLATGASQKIKSIQMLGSSGKVVWTQSSYGLLIKSNAAYPAKQAVVYKLRFE
nr:hypothetical protein [Saprospiraceae bacterium]